MRRGVATALGTVGLLASCATADAAVSFGRITRISSGGNRAYGLTVSVVDGTGVPNVAVANMSSDNVVLFAPDGSGGLAQVATAPLTGGSAPVYVAALPTSSTPDLLVSDNGTAKVTYLNVLTGGFQVLSDHSVGVNPNQIATGDFDGNGRAEFAVSDFSSSKVSVFTNTNGGVPLNPAPDVPTAASPIGLAAADVNGDGDLDLLIGRSGGVDVALGQAGVTFAAPVPAAAITGSNRDIAVADFNRDGDPDIVVATDPFPNGVRVAFGGAGASFSAPVTAFGNSANGVGAADVTGDGVPDVLVADALGQVEVVESNGDGTFQTARGIFSDVGATFRDITALDVDGDGDQDAVVSHDATPGELVLAQNTSQPAAVLSAAQLAFAGQPAGTAGGAAGITVSNTGGARPLHVTGAAVAGGDDFVIAADECAGQTIAVGASCRVSVRFAPGSPGDKTATLRILDDAPGSPQTVALSGTGLDAPVGPQGAAGAPGQTVVKLVVALLDSKLRVRAGHAVTLPLAVTKAADLTLDVLKGKAQTRVARVKGRAKKAGRAVLRWSGKVKGKPAKRGAYKLRVTAVAADGQTAKATVALTLTR